MPTLLRPLSKNRFHSINVFWAKWFALALLVGCAAGLAAVAFQFLTDSIQQIALGGVVGLGFSETTNEVSAEGVLPNGFNVWLIIPVLAVGGLATGLLVYWMAPEAEGHGTDAAIDAFHNHRGNIRPRVPIIKAIASAITLGTGGSAGREGPIAQIGAGFGSYLGARFGLSAQDRRILLAIGMGAGIGAIFRAPLAGAIFAGEILYRDADIESEVIIPGALASTVAYSVFQLSLRRDLQFTPLFGDLNQYEVATLTELLPYTVLAVVLVMASFVYVKTFYFATETFKRIPIVPHLKPMIGATIAGAITVGAFLLMHRDPLILSALGSGYGLLHAALTDVSQISLWVLFLVAGIKILTTSLTIGSGGSGGVFGPSMVIGGATGAGVGKIFHQALPEVVTQPGAFTIVGMAGFFAGCANAPFSTILMVTEMTGSYKLLLPTLWVACICFILCRQWSMYSKQVPSRIDSPAHRGDFTIDLLEGILVRDVYRKTDEGIIFHEEDSLDKIVHALAESTQRYYHVYNSTNELVGIFSSEDVRRYLYDDVLWKIANANDVMSESVVTVQPDDDLNHALGRFTALNVDELPVVLPDDMNRIIGVLRRKETIAMYNKRRLEMQKARDDENR